MGQSATPLYDQVSAVYAAAAASDDGECCMISPAPELRKRIAEELEAANREVKSLPAAEVQARPTTAFGLDDGLIIHGTEFPLGTPPVAIRNAAANRAPLRGVVRVIVVMVDFSDKAMSASKPDIEKLFFSEGQVPTGSVRDYYREVTHGLVDIQGQVVGPLRLPQALAYYAKGEFGRGKELPNGRTMARDAVEAADTSIDFGPYDNDGNGYVDAFIVVHAGSGAEQTGSTSDMWSHKWVLEGNPYETDGTKVYGYLTIPEDAKLGVCAHELGHLLFGWPDLYDTDESSEGVGDWCLMGSGSWNGNRGDRPAHPSAWCKMGQAWVTVANQTANGITTIGDIKSSHTVHRLWRNGEASQEYYLLENRQRTGFDDNIPGDGFLLWKVDEAVEDNTNESHPLLALVQADGKRQLEKPGNQGDKGDPYPGSTGNRAFSASSTPSSNSYAGAPTDVEVTEISDPGSTMTARLSVRPHVKHKETVKDLNETKPTEKLPDKSHQRDKPIGEKGHEKIPDTVGALVGPSADAYSLAGLEARLAAVEARLGPARPFISSALRPDLGRGAFAAEPDAGGKDQERITDPLQKRLLDVPPAIG